jgi:hypothetical protein
VCKIDPEDTVLPGCTHPLVAVLQVLLSLLMTADQALMG